MEWMGNIEWIYIPRFTEIIKETVMENKKKLLIITIIVLLVVMIVLLIELLKKRNEKILFDDIEYIYPEEEFYIEKVKDSSTFYTIHSIVNN